MSKITFRADDDLVTQLEEYDASKSEVMREALREYLEGGSDDEGDVRGFASGDTLDGLIARRVDAVVASHLDESCGRSQPQDVNVTITLDAEGALEHTSTADASLGHATAGDDEESDAARKTKQSDDDHATESPSSDCSQCGETITDGHVYCPNCGEKATHRVFCECGDELRSDWGFCPSCGRRTPAADVLDRT